MQTAQATGILQAMPRKRTHGGKRKGAGRPPELEDPVDVTVVLERSQRDRLDELAEQRGVPSRSHVVRALIDEADG